MTAFFFSTKARLYVQVFDNSPDYIPESGVFFGYPSNFSLLKARRVRITSSDESVRVRRRFL